MMYELEKGFIQSSMSNSFKYDIGNNKSNSNELHNLQLPVILIEGALFYFYTQQLDHII